MRLASLLAGRHLRHRLFVRLTRAMGAEINDLGKLAMRRPEMFGIPMLGIAQELLRGPSTWTVGEREQLAAAVSRANECPFCVGMHGEIAAQIQSTEQPSPRVMAACRFVEKLTHAPETVDERDVAAARAANVDDAALADAVRIAFFFNVMNRMANALDFKHPSERARVRRASLLRRTGYRLPGFLLRDR
jgi:uncharacterized peroxidase-related enzyme